MIQHWDGDLRDQTQYISYILSIAIVGCEKSCKFEESALHKVAIQVCFQLLY